MAPQRGIFGGTAGKRALLAAPLAAALLAAGCNSADNRFSGDGISASISEGQSEAKLNKAAEHWAGKFAANPKDKKAALNLSRVLRAQGKKAQAVVVLRQATLHHSDDKEFQGELGKALADAGRNAEAISILERLAAGGHADWRLLSSYGTVLDQMERHAEARNQYQRALRLEPNEPSVLSNLGLSYALDRNLPKAEKTLRLAAAQPKAEDAVRQNLALVLGLQGKFAEAEQVARTTLPERETNSNLSYLKQMLSQPQNWAKLQALEAKNKPAAARQANAR